MHILNAEFLSAGIVFSEFFTLMKCKLVHKKLDGLSRNQSNLLRVPYTVNIQLQKMCVVIKPEGKKKEMTLKRSRPFYPTHKKYSSALIFAS